jgi:protein SCO1
MQRIALLLALLLTAFAAGPASAQMSYGRAPRVNKEPDLPPGVGVEQKLGAKVPLDLKLFDHEGRETTIGEATAGKPTILVLAYFACPKLCTEVLNGLVGEMKALARLGLKCGDDYRVVTVSINPKDAPAFARMKRRSYLDELDKRPDSEAGWAFLTASHGQGTDLLEAQDKITLLATAVGFGYQPDNFKAYEEADALLATDAVKGKLLREKAIRKTKDYVHASTLIVLTNDGTISRYHHGLAPVDHTAEDVRKSLKDAAGGSIGSLSTQMATLCFAYDQATGHYQPVMNALALAAAPFPFLIAGIIYLAFRRHRREKVALQPATT